MRMRVPGRVGVAVRMSMRVGSRAAVVLMLHGSAYGLQGQRYTITLRGSAHSLPSKRAGKMPLTQYGHDAALGGNEWPLSALRQATAVHTLP
jgi:hypothetical protein